MIITDNKSPIKVKYIHAYVENEHFKIPLQIDGVEDKNNLNVSANNFELNHDHFIRVIRF